MDKVYLCIDLKTFYASVECAERHLNPFETNLIVADPDRSKNTICLAITPKMKSMGVRNRCRICEIPSDMDYIVARPRMKLYIRYAAEIYAIYLKYIAKEDIFVYSIDECFIDLTGYLSLYRKSPAEMAEWLIRDVMNTTQIPATAGIGTNLFLAKVALDILAKNSPDQIGYLNESLFKNKIWHHRPITDIWQIGPQTAKRLAKYHIEDLYGITQTDEKILYREFGRPAEYLIDHAHGYEPCTIEEIHRYQPRSKSLSYRQVFMKDYTSLMARRIVIEMVEVACLDLVDRKIVIQEISLSVSYRDIHKRAHLNLGEYTQSYRKLKEAFLDLWNRKIEPIEKVRKIGIGFSHIASEDFKTWDLFSNETLDFKETTLFRTLNSIQKKYGKNAVIKGMNLEEDSTAIIRNQMIGGHQSE